MLFNRHRECTFPAHASPVLRSLSGGDQRTTETATGCGHEELAYARLKIQVLEEHLRLRRIAKYGPASEKLSNLQLELLEEEPGITSEEVQAEGQCASLPSSSPEKKPRRPHPGRQTSARRSAPRGKGYRLHAGAVRVR